MAAGAFHPCFHDAARATHGRIHLPVAGPCNIACGYCDRRYDCVNESRPGVASRLMTPDEAVDLPFLEADRDIVEDLRALQSA